jgi:hypothetical protein
METKLLLKLIDREIAHYRAKGTTEKDQRFYLGAIWALEEVKREISTVDPMGLGGIWRAIKDENGD